MRFVRLFVATLLVGLLGTGAWAQWHTMPVEMVFRDGHREVVRAAPFAGIAEGEVRLGRGGTYDRGELTLVCFRPCPEAVASDPTTADMVVRRNGARSYGQVEVADAEGGLVLRQNGEATPIRQVHYIRFTEPSLALAD